MKGFLADFHIHSTLSDGKLSIPELVDLYGKRGFGAIAITDHLCETKSVIGKAARILEKSLTPATFPIYQAILRSEIERAWNDYQMVLIPGIEITKNSISESRSAHVLSLGTRDFISADDPLETVLENIRNLNGVSVAAHPIGYELWSRREEFKTTFDAWEVASGRLFQNEVFESSLPMLATSDLHAPKQICAWKTLFHCERREDQILDAIRNQDLEFRFYDGA